jgi:hypothetical protein
MIKKLVLFPIILSLTLNSLYAITVTLAWDRNGDGITAGYNVYRSATPGGPYTKINLDLIPEPVPNETPQYIDSTIPTGSTITYYYVVRAANAGGTESANSTEVIANPPPKVPQNPRIVSFSAANLEVDGTKVASGPPFPVIYILPRQTPPRLVPIKVTIE